MGLLAVISMVSSVEPPCNEPNCNEDQNIDCLLRNAPASDGSLHQLIKNTIEKTIDNQFEKQNEKSYSYYLLLKLDFRLKK